MLPAPPSHAMAVTHMESRTGTCSVLPRMLQSVITFFLSLSFFFTRWHFAKYCTYYMSCRHCLLSVTRSFFAWSCDSLLPLVFHLPWDCWSPNISLNAFHSRHIVSILVPTLPSFSQRYLLAQVTLLSIINQY